MRLMALPPRRRRPLGKGQHSRAVDPTTVHGLLWLALRWESAVREKTGHRIRVVDPRLRQIKLPYVKTFKRFAEYLKQSNTTADRYFTLLLARFGDRTPYTKQLGSTFYNTIVAEQANRRKQMFDGRDDAMTQSYLVRRPTEPGDSAWRIAVDAARLAVYRRQYHWFEWGRFWMFFAGEFSGAFLFLSPEYRHPGVPDLLSEEQRREWSALEQDEKRRDRARSHYRLFRRRVGSLECRTIETTNIEALASMIYPGPHSPQHLSA